MKVSLRRLAVLLVGLWLAMSCAIDPVPTPGSGDVNGQVGEHGDVGSGKGNEDAALGAGDSTAPNGCSCFDNASGDWCEPTAAEGGEVKCSCECEVESCEIVQEVLSEF